MNWVMNSSCSLFCAGQLGARLMIEAAGVVPLVVQLVEVPLVMTGDVRIGERCLPEAFMYCTGIESCRSDNVPPLLGSCMPEWKTSPISFESADARFCSCLWWRLRRCM